MPLYCTQHSVINNLNPSRKKHHHDFSPQKGRTMKPNPMLHFLPFIFISLMNLLPLCSSDPRISEALLLCDRTRRTTDTTNFFPLFTAEMEKISAQLNTNNFGSSGLRESKVNMSIYALAQCYDDLKRTDCLLCYAATRTRLPRCLPSLGARIYLDGCFLRYDDYNFFNESTDPGTDAFNCTSSLGAVAAEETAAFRRRVGFLVDNVTAAAVRGDGYAVMEMNGVYGLAQCWRSLKREECRACLDEANRNVAGCVPSREARAMNAGCFLRYSTKKFYNDGNSTTSSGTKQAGKTVAIVASVAVFCMLSAFAAYALYSRRKKKKQERKNLGRISNLYNKSNLNYKYDILEKATKYFDPSTKVGQGGAGSVYKGTLPDGKVVAVKRLLFNTRQWVDEFFNEVNLITGIQHKNLVKLLGCSIEGPESLLIYEFVPNQSLEHYIFDKKVKILSWKERFQIIVGTAEGLAFLHGGTDHRIIHRDIKSSNVLLDENFNPKIADFGLARHFADDQSHLSTGIAGTLGYMAPEYLVKGQLTEKADVYSFGVLVLEIVCGRQNNAFVEGSGSLLQTVWRLFKTNKVWEAVDSCLKGDFPTEEAYSVMRIGLLCTQASAPLRPSMDEVVAMLLDPNEDVREPNQPPFVNASVLGSHSAGSSSSTGSLLRNAYNKIETTYTTSTGSSSFQSSSVPSRS